MPEVEFTKWVACFGNATSISDRKESTYAKDLTLRYPVRMRFSGSKLRFHFSNLTGTEDVKISEAYVAVESRSAESHSIESRGIESRAGEKCASADYRPISITFGGATSGTIPAGEEILSDEIPLNIVAGDTVEISLYFANYTQMNAGTLVTGPLSSGKFAYGNFARARELPQNLSRSTNWFYFLNTIDVFTKSENFALVCYGDSITAQDWPDYLTLRCEREGFKNVAIIRRAVCGTRILREYNCITYAAYGLKGATRFPIEMNVAGAKAVIIQHGINDIIHPVGVEVNKFRPWSDMPTVSDLVNGVRELYVKHARAHGLKVYSGTLLPIFGWRTYNENREIIRLAFNEWLRNAPDFDGCVDFDFAVRDAQTAKTTSANSMPEKFAAGFDSGDHLHPSAKAYEAMAESVPAEILQ